MPLHSLLYEVYGQQSVRFSQIYTKGHFLLTKLNRKADRGLIGNKLTPVGTTTVQWHTYEMIKRIKALRVLMGTAALKRSNREVVS